MPPGPVLDRLANWPGKLDGAGGDALALRLAGALHYLVLSAQDEDLSRAYPPRNADGETLSAALRSAIARHGDFIDRFLDSAPQTNETGRSAVLLPAFLRLRARHGLPLVLSELGSSAGLNQNWHRYHYDYGDWEWGDPDAAVTLSCEWRGETPPAPLPVIVAESAGCDIAPVSIASEQDRWRLTSYVWPDQRARLERLAGALGIAGEWPPTVARAGAADWLAGRLGERRADHLHVVFHTIMWQYVPPGEQARATALIEAAGRVASPAAPLAWLRFEPGGEGEGAGLMMTTWDGVAEEGETVILGRGDFHGRWVEWRPAA